MLHALLICYDATRIRNLRRHSRLPPFANKPSFPGVDITLKNVFSNDEYRTVSDNTGAFLIADVPEGVYILTIAGGMKSISGTADVSREVLDVIHTSSRALLPFKLKDTGCYGTEFQLSD